MRHPFKTGFNAGFAFGGVLVIVQFVAYCIFLVGLKEHWWFGR